MTDRDDYTYDDKEPSQEYDDDMLTGAREEEEDTRPVSILDLAEYRLGREASTGQDFEDAGLPILGGCEGCGATIAAYNAYPSKTGFLRCADCIADLGWGTVQEANDALFGTHLVACEETNPE